MEENSHTAASGATQYMLVVSCIPKHICSIELTIYAPASTLLSIDLRSDWVNDSVVINSIPKPSNIPSLVETGLWYHQASETVYGGFAGRRSEIATPVPSPYPLSLYSFKSNHAGSGTFDIVVNSSEWGSNTRSMQGAVAFGNDTGYVLGGCARFDTSLGTANYQNTVPLDGLLTFDMNSQKLSNISATGYNGNGTVEFAKMEYVPTFGPKGVFILLGGDQPDFEGPTATDYYVPFTNVAIYEPSSNRWYQQPTSGRIPEPRKEFCTAGVASTNETYEIFLYAGWGGLTGSPAIPYDEIFILTLPAFTWIKVDYPPNAPRHGLSCNAVGGSQIITIGGLDTKAWNANASEGYLSPFNTTDPFANGLNIFDMSTLGFASKYSANPPPYTQSDLVAGFYASNPNPTFSDPNLGNLMNQKNFNRQTIGLSAGSNTAPTHNSTSTAVPTSNPTTSPLPPSVSSPLSSSKIKPRTIIGAVIGSVAGSVLLSAAAFFLVRLWRRHRSNQYPSSPAAHEVDVTPASPWPKGPLCELSGQCKPKELPTFAEPKELAGGSPPSEMDAGAFVPKGMLG